jgi:hypothetical protein
MAVCVIHTTFNSDRAHLLSLFSRGVNAMISREVDYPPMIPGVSTNVSFYFVHWRHLLWQARRIALNAATANPPPRFCLPVYFAPYKCKSWYFLENVNPSSYIPHTQSLPTPGAMRRSLEGNYADTTVVHQNP